MKAEKGKIRCDECGWQGFFANLLEGINPFEEGVQESGHQNTENLESFTDKNKDFASSLWGYTKTMLCVKDTSFIEHPATLEDTSDI
jgi:hypothetical protein